MHLGEVGFRVGLGSVATTTNQEDALDLRAEMWVVSRRVVGIPLILSR